MYVSYHFFTWIILMHVLALTHNLIDRVLDGIDTPCIRMLYDPNRVPQTPTQKQSIRLKIIPRIPYITKTESLDLAMA